MRTALIMFGLLLTHEARADWYYYVMKIECGTETLRVINYSAYNEEGIARGKEPGAIDVDKLSTWRHTEDGLNIPDKPLPHIEICKIPSGKYKVILTNAGGGYSAPYPVVNVLEISNPKKPKLLIDNLALPDVVEKQEIAFSRENPNGLVINE